MHLSISLDAGEWIMWQDFIRNSAKNQTANLSNLRKGW